VPSSLLVDCLLKRKRIEPGTVVIHFDDCYREVRACAAPLLRAAGLSATAFISSGFVDTDRAFAHDVQKYPHVFENLRAGELRSLTEYGLEIGSHTVNHVDLGAVDIEQARLEVFESRRQLEQILKRPVLLFSFPFGRLENIREEVRQMVRNAGYQALFSAHGGFPDDSTDPFDIPRFGVSWEHSPLCLMMDLEGLSILQLKQSMTRNSGKAGGS
jgi:peptidoglycan/xylan/chitin deacetylase (PgdA/CDA1 family)